MHIQKLKIENLRNISHAEIYPHKNINIILGKNGAGKTTLLESIYLLARAKSFRVHITGPLIKEGTEVINLYTILKTASNERHKIGLQKSAKNTVIKKDGQNLRKLSELAKTIPLTIITPNTQRIIEEDPKQRRRLLNWGLFHVEPQYGDLANRYKKILIQRNRALKESRDQIKVWDRQLVGIGEEIDLRMQKYVGIWNQSINTIIETTKMIKPISLKLMNGWKEGETFEQSLERNREVDRQRGFTGSGPHRSDIKLFHSESQIKNIFSRGEAKITAIIMLLAQMKILADSSGDYPLLLADDLQSELDNETYYKLLSFIGSVECQTFITTLNPLDKEVALDSDAYQLFHVEHGVVS